MKERRQARREREEQLLEAARASQLALAETYLLLERATERLESQQQVILSLVRLHLPETREMLLEVLSSLRPDPSEEISLKAGRALHPSLSPASES